MKNMKLSQALLVILFISSFNLNAQTPEEKKHEIGVTTEYWAGRLVPGIQYYYNLNSGQQLGFNLSATIPPVGSESILFSPHISFEYRLRMHLTQGLSAYITPTAQINYFRVQGSNDIVSSYGFGLGFNTGLEYDFSKNNVPLIFGVGMKSMVTHSFARFDYSFRPVASLRFKF